MKCLEFTDRLSGLKTIQAYNEWAKNKILAKDVIIHSHLATNIDGAPYIIILVFFDERIHPDW